MLRVIRVALLGHACPLRLFEVPVAGESNDERGKGQRFPPGPSRTARTAATPDRRCERTPFSRPFGNVLPFSVNDSGRANIFSALRLFQRHGRGTVNPFSPTATVASPHSPGTSGGPGLVPGRFARVASVGLPKVLACPVAAGLSLLMVLREHNLSALWA